MGFLLPAVPVERTGPPVGPSETDQHQPELGQRPEDHEHREQQLLCDSGGRHQRRPDGGRLDDQRDAVDVPDNDTGEDGPDENRQIDPQVGPVRSRNPQARARRTQSNVRIGAVRTAR